jgi:hypothetical protein
MYRAFQILDEPTGSDTRYRRALRIRNQLSYSPFTSRRRRIVEEFGKILRASIAKGLLAGKAIALPALLIQGLILLIVCGYYFYPPARQIIEVAVNLKKEGGFFFSFICTASIAVFAECLRSAFGDSESRRRLLPNCAYGFLVFGVLGILTDTFYILQKSLWSAIDTAGRGQGGHGSICVDCLLCESLPDASLCLQGLRFQFRVVRAEVESI